MPPEDESPPPKETEKEKDESAPRHGTSRIRGIVLMVLAILGLTAVMTLIVETVSHRGPGSPGARGNDLTPASPAAAEKSRISTVIVVTVSFNGLLVDGLDVAPLTPLIENGRSEIIPALKSAMDERRGASSIGGPIGLLVQKDMPRNVTRSVMLTLALAGYRDVHLIGAHPDAGEWLRDD